MYVVHFSLLLFRNWIHFVRMSSDVALFNSKKMQCVYFWAFTATTNFLICCIFGARKSYFAATRFEWSNVKGGVSVRITSWRDWVVTMDTAFIVFSLWVRHGGSAVQFCRTLLFPHTSASFGFGFYSLAWFWMHEQMKNSWDVTFRMEFTGQWRECAVLFFNFLVSYLQMKTYAHRCL